MANTNERLSLYKDENSPLSLYQVLIDEYYAQHPGKCRDGHEADEGEVKGGPEKFFERFTGALEKLKADYGLGCDLEEKDRERIEKKINSEMVKEFYRWVHERRDERARSALCLSGGGIRSATFALGVVQGLARHGLLDKFDYLSTVSGGGYLGGWLSAWIHRRGLDGVVTRLKNPAKRQSPLQPEPEPVKHLRTYSNYMSPKVGLLSADAWTLVAIYLRNLLLNWMVLVPLILSAILLPRVYAWAVAAAQKPNSREWAAALGPWLFGFGVACGVCAVGYIYVNRPSLGVRLRPRWRSQKRFLLCCLLPFLLLTACSTISYAWAPAVGERLGWVPGWLSWLKYGEDGTGLWRLFVTFGVVLQLGGVLLALAVIGYMSLRDKEPVLPPAQKRWRYPVELVVTIPCGALSGLLTWLLATNIFPHQPGPVGDVGRYVLPVGEAAYYSCFALPLFLLLVLASVTLFVGLMSRRTSDADREWLARASGWLLIAAFAWAVVSAVVVFGPVVLLREGAVVRPALTSVGFLSGLVTLVFGRSPKSPANTKEAEKRSTFSSLGNFGITLAAAVFAVFIIALLSLLTSVLFKSLVQPPVSGALHWLSQHLVGAPACLADDPSVSYDPHLLLSLLYHTPGRVLLAFFAATFFVSLGMAFGVNINKFSLHAAYRDRLIRAYLGASRNERDRSPNPFTGFDERDNLQMQELRTQRFNADAVIDLRGFAEGLAAGQSRKASPEGFVCHRLTAELRRRLEDYRRGGGEYDETREKDLKAALAAELNLIIETERLYEAEEFETYWKNSDEIGALVPSKDEDGGDVGVERLRANRRLMEIVFNDEAGPERCRSVFKRAKMCMPFHVVNTTLNLVGGEDLAWQSRKAESFTVSPLHSGSYCVGYRDSRTYAMNTDNEAISLGTAVAVSGAAVSPNMGYHSSPLVTFLLTLFNVRLGWWLGNPGRAGRDTFNHAGPVIAFKPIISEALGLTNDRNKYIYVSDGGHFENLGLYEMILRRCRYIVVCDGSEDHDYTFEGLGNAISKVRVDLGVPIDFEKIMIYPRDYKPQGDEKPGYCALGRIRYSCADSPRVTGGDGCPPADSPPDIDGYLLYIKATLTGTEPKDIYNYAHAHEAFPHESTGDQMYSEEQFESYRELGSHAFEQIYKKFYKAGNDGRPDEPRGIEDFFGRLDRSLGDGAKKASPPLC